MAGFPSLGAYAALTTATLTSAAVGQQISDGTYTLSVVDTGGLGNWELAVLREQNPPAPHGSGGISAGGSFLTSMRAAGSPANTTSGKLYVDAMCTVLEVVNYNDSAVVAYASTTGHEIDLSIAGTQNDQNVLGLYTAPISGYTAPSGIIHNLYGIKTDTWIGDAAAGGLTITNAYGGYFARPYVSGANMTVTNQWSLYAERGQHFDTNGGGGSNEAFAIMDTSNSTFKYLRVSNAELQILNTNFSAVVAAVADNGQLLANGGVTPNGASGGVSSTLFSGSGAPAAGLGADGDFYFREDTPGTANQRLYVKSAGAWTGIL